MSAKNMVHPLAQQIVDQADAKHKAAVAQATYKVQYACSMESF